MLRISTCSEMFADRMDLKQTLTVLNELEFEYFDVAWKFLAPYTSGEKPFSELREMLSTFRVRPVAIMGAIDFGVSQRRITKQTNVVKEHVAAARELDVEIIRVFASLVPDRYIDDHAIENVIANMQQACLLTDGTNVKLAIENHFGVTSTADDVLRILEGIGSQRVGVTFDPANFVISGEDPVAAAGKLSPYILHVHAKDCLHTGVGKWGGYEFVEVGRGIVDYEAIMSTLQKNGYDGYVALEYEKAEDVVRGTMLARRNLGAVL